MTEGKREKSKKYPGVYFRVNPETKERTYYIRYRIGGRGSKEVEEPVGKSSGKMTEAKAANIRGDRMRGKALSNTERRAAEQAAKDAEAGRWTVERIWNAYKDAHPTQASLKAWASLFNTHISNTRLAKKIPSEIVNLDIDRLRREVAGAKHHRTGQPLAPQTVKHVVALLKRLLRWAAGEDEISVEPAVHLNFKKVLKPVEDSINNEKTEFMNAEERQAYLNALDEEADQDAAAYFRVMLLTGVRKTALLALEWNDVNFQTGFITLKAETAKNSEPAKIPMSAKVRKILKSITVTESSYVWPGRNGARRVDFQRMARRLRDKAGLGKDFRPCHGLRHDYASRMASSGKVKMYMLQQLLTHGSAKMTQRYAHLADEAKQAAAAVADETLTPAQSTEEAVG